MKLSTIKGLRKRKLNTSLLKIVDSKKPRVQQKATPVYKRREKHHNYNIQSKFTDQQFIVAKRNNNYLRHRKQYKHFTQQEKVLNYHANKKKDGIKCCGCLICIRRFETFQQNQKHQIQMAIRHKTVQSEETNSYVLNQEPTSYLLLKQFNTEVNLNSMQARLYTEESFNPSKKAQALKSSIHNAKIGQHNANFHRNYCSIQLNNLIQMQTNQSDVSKQRSYMQQLNEKNKYQCLMFPSYYYKTRFANHDELFFLKDLMARLRLQSNQLVATRTL